MTISPLVVQSRPRKVQPAREVDARLDVTMLDPGNFLPYYNASLCEALSSLGLNIELITSVFLFEDLEKPKCYREERVFFRLIRGDRRQWFRDHARIRRALKMISYPVGLWRVWRMLSRRTPSVLHIQMVPIPVLDAFLLRRLRRKGWRIVYTAHDVVSELRKPMRRRRTRKIYRYTDAVIVHTAGLAQKLKEDSSDVVRRICTIPEGVSAFPMYASLTKAEARLGLGINPKSPVVLFFGMIKPYKGLEYLLSAWRKVHGAFPEARLLVVGVLMEFRPPISRLIDSLGIRDSVVVRLGYVPRSEVHPFFVAADAVALPYTEISTSGIVPVSYRFARPVIATSAGAMADIVIDGETGFVVPPDSADALADVICRGFLDLDALAAMGAHARTWFENEHNWTDIAQQTAMLYRSLLSGANPQPAAAYSA